MKSLVNDYSRICKYGSIVTSSGIDYIVCNIPQISYDNFDPGVSDHHVQISHLSAEVIECRSKIRDEFVFKKRRFFSENNIHEFRTHMRKFCPNSSANSPGLFPVDRLCQTTKPTLPETCIRYFFYTR